MLVLHDKVLKDPHVALIGEAVDGDEHVGLYRGPHLLDLYAICTFPITLDKALISRDEHVTNVSLNLIRIQFEISVKAGILKHCLLAQVD